MAMQSHNLLTLLVYICVLCIDPWAFGTFGGLAESLRSPRGLTATLPELAN